jgi:hypothetical protein
MYTDTDSLYLALSVNTLEEALIKERREEFYQIHHHWFPSECCDTHRTEFVTVMSAETQSKNSTGSSQQHVGHRKLLWLPRRECCQQRYAYDQRTAGLFKTEFTGRGMVCLCAKTYYCLGDGERLDDDDDDDDDEEPCSGEVTSADCSISGPNDKYSCKGIHKSSNTITFSHYRDVLRGDSIHTAINKGIRVDTTTGRVVTYAQKRRGLTFYYGKRKVRDDGIATDPLEL